MPRDEKRLARNAANQRARRARKRNGEIGRYDPLPLEPTRKLLRAAQREGISFALLALEVGMDDKSLRDILYPGRKHVTVATAEAVRVGVARARARAARGDVSEKRVLVDETRTLCRRLGAAGWPIQQILAEHGLPENVWRDRAKYCRPETAAAVRDLYNKVGGELGPSLASARYWRRKGYLIPSAERPEDQKRLPPPINSARRRRAIKARRQALTAA
jgi:hypothetical protein